jgi:hypothetical protein
MAINYSIKEGCIACIQSSREECEKVKSSADAENFLRSRMTGLYALLQEEDVRFEKSE